MTTNQIELQTIKRPCKVITLQEKLAILKQLEAGTSRREVELMFKCSQSTISRVLSGKEVIMQEAEGNVPSKRESLISYKELDFALSQWAREMKKSDAMITARMAKQKAEELCLAMGHELKPSTAWFYKWKERESIKFAKRIKDPEEILRELLDKREKSEQMHTINEEASKRLKLDNEANKTKCLEEKEKIADNAKNNSLPGNAETSDNKPRVKRDYVKRLPIIDASGMICRSRKEKTFLTLLQKLEILQRLKNGERRPDLIAEYKLSQSAMSQIVTDEVKILKLAAGGQNLQMKRIRGGIFKGGEAELNAWVREKMEIGESLTRTQIKNRAKEIAERLNIDFKASTGWLEKWKTRMNLDFNENQILQRKVPNYLATDEELENSYLQFEQSDSFYDQQDGDTLRNEIKEEQIENDYCDDVETNDEFSYNDINETDVKPEIITPQQFYLQTIQADTQSLNTELSQHKEKIVPEEDTDIKPFNGTPPHIQIEETTKTGETLHGQVLHWLNRYNIASAAASELLNILQPHLSSKIHK